MKKFKKKPTTKCLQNWLKIIPYFQKTFRLGSQFGAENSQHNNKKKNKKKQKLKLKLYYLHIAIKIVLSVRQKNHTHIYEGVYISI